MQCRLLGSLTGTADGRTPPETPNPSAGITPRGLWVLLHQVAGRATNLSLADGQASRAASARRLYVDLVLAGAPSQDRLGWASA